MKFSRLTAVLLLCVTASACRDSTAPGIRVYQLTEVNGQPLPFSLPGGIDVFATVISGGLVLDNSGHALRTTRMRIFSANLNSTGESSDGRQDDYRIDNGTITVGSLNGCTSSCVNSESGVYTGDMLTLTLDVIPRTFPVYTYRLVSRF
jgi:hypothetical protein